MMPSRVDQPADDEATIIEAYPLDFAQDPAGGTSSGKKGKGAAATMPKRQATVVVDGKDLDPKLTRTVEDGRALAQVGTEDHFIVAWGRANASVRSRGRQLLMSTCLNVALVVVVGFLAWRNEQKETYVFVRDALGNVVQADASTFLHAGDARTEAEIKGFVRRWVLDAYTWTPLDVEDRLKAALRLVETKAQPVVKAGLGLAERRALVERGVSGRVHDERESGKEAHVVITRTKPLEVMVGFDRFQIDRSGAATELGHLFLRAHLKEVPRSPANPAGLMIVDTEMSERL
jgi:hypothetical protein